MAGHPERTPHLMRGKSRDPMDTNMTRIKQLGLLLILLLLAGGIFFNRVRLRALYDDWTRPALPEAVEYPRHPERSESAEALAKAGEAKSRDITSLDPSTPPAESAGSAQDDGSTLPLEYNLDVPFQSQAPTLNWDMPYQEACEEASLIMADAFFNGRGLTVEGMDTSIKKLVDWQQKRFGYYEDTTPAEVVSIAKEYFNLNATLDYDVSVENIKKYISQNKLVLVPAAGKVLPNPYFKNGGPLYHMLVIRGYTQDKFITNDPGTKRGKEFVYKYNDLLNAVHAWPRETGGSKRDVTEAEMLTGEKVMIIVDRVK